LAVPQADARSAKRAQNYAPAPLALKPAAPPPAVANAIVPAPMPGSAVDSQPALEPVPAPAAGAPPANLARASAGALSMSADRAARISRERTDMEPARLESAAAAGDLAQTTRLLDQGATVNARDALGRTPLLMAVAQNRLEVVRLLLARGADPDAADNAGVTPLQLATDKDLTGIAALLQRAGAH
jgi:ankyrin repeat protein